HHRRNSRQLRRPHPHRDGIPRRLRRYLHPLLARRHVRPLRVVHPRLPRPHLHMGLQPLPPLRLHPPPAKPPQRLQIPPHLRPRHHPTSFVLAHPPLGLPHQGGPRR